MHMDNEQKVVVALAADLIFAARIRSAAGAVKVILARDVEDFLTKVRTLQPPLAVLDLDRRGLAVEQVVREVKATRGVELLAYVSHVREDLIATARAAGADRVMPRGAFAKQLPEILR
jgi:ActR/RegA family two-component response regulator